MPETSTPYQPWVAVATPHQTVWMPPSPGDALARLVLLASTVMPEWAEECYTALMAAMQRAAQREAMQSSARAARHTARSGFRLVWRGEPIDGRTRPATASAPVHNHACSWKVRTDERPR